jgi:AraC-like DNA-binding protein
MARTGQNAKWLDYNPNGRPLDLEVFSFASLRRRESLVELETTHRFSFYTLICVTEGEVSQLVDFEPIACAAGSILVLRPGQVHNFGGVEWDGWMVIFRSEFLPSESETVSELIPALGLDRLPNHVQLPESDFRAISDSVSRMQQDGASDAQTRELHALLRYQLCALLLRLTILHDRDETGVAGRSRGLQRFTKFRRLLELNFTGWHHVAQYADALACTEKSLTRSALEVTGRTAKEVIAQRITLEAKRLLAHTDRPVSLVSETLGFDEATNFAKFFRRETGLSPRQFRQEQAG